MVLLVLYTDERAWNTPINLPSLMRLPPGLKRFVREWAGRER